MDILGKRLLLTRKVPRQSEDDEVTTIVLPHLLQLLLVLDDHDVCRRGIRVIEVVQPLSEQRIEYVLEYAGKRSRKQHAHFHGLLLLFCCVIRLF